MGCGASAVQTTGTKWEILDARLPYRKDKGDLKKREVLFKKFDQNNRGSLTADDCLTGCVKHLLLKDVCEKDVGRVSQAAFDASHLLRTKADATDNVDPQEFRLYLQYLRDFFEYSSIFDEVDKSGDGTISKEEFKVSAPKFKKYGVPIADSDNVFREVDTDKRGTISFAEFCDWASQQELDREKADRLEALQAKADAKTRQDRMARMTKLRERIPNGYSAADKEKRRALFVKFDDSKNGKLTEDECLTGSNKHLEMANLAPAKDVEVINKAAFNQAKAAASKPSADSKSVDENEFNLYLISLRDHHELNEMFIEMDKGDAKGKSAGDRQVTKEEFKRAVPKVEAWGKKVPDADKAFVEVDTDGKGTISFEEFCAWASKHHLDVEEDDKTKDEAHKLLEAKREEEANAMKRKEEDEKAAAVRDQRAHALANLEATLPPNGSSPAERARRDELFTKFDTKANGELTLDECAEGSNKHLRLDEICGKENAVIINRSAFTSAKGTGTGKAHTVDKSEFQAYTVALRNNYELNEMFVEMDKGDAKGKSSGDRQVTKEEFKRAVPKVEAWGKRVPDADKAFSEIDTDGKGTVSFPEFCDWANKHHLDIEKADEKADEEQAAKDAAMEQDVAASKAEASSAPASRGLDFGQPSGATAPSNADTVAAQPNDDSAAAQPTTDSASSDKAADKAAEDNSAAEKAAAEKAAEEKAAEEKAAADKAAEEKAAADALVEKEAEELRKAEEEAVAAQKIAEAAQRKQAEAEAAGDAEASKKAAEEAERAQANADREAAEADAAKADLEEAKKSDEEKAAELREEVARRKALWAELRPKFPLDRTKESTKKRLDIFAQFDNDGKETLSEDECLQGSRNVLGLEGVVADLPTLNKRSFAAAAGPEAKPSVNKDEFRMYLSHLRNTIEIREMFNDVDSSDDGKVTREEFLRAAPKLKEWGLVMKDDNASFDALDKDGKGLVDFDEFAAFAMKNDLDMEKEEIVALEAARKHAAEQEAKKANMSDEQLAKQKADKEKRKSMWESIKPRLPRQKNKDENEARNNLFKEFDLAKNGVISFDECKSGCYNILHLDDFYDNLSPIMRRSFYHAATARGPQSDEFEKLTIERVEFRIFLVFIYDYLDLFVQFEEREFTLDDRIDEKMFTECVPILTSWGITLNGTIAENFDAVDEYDVGSVDFDTFADWAVAQHMKAQNVKITMSRAKLNFGKS